MNVLDTIVERKKEELRELKSGGRGRDLIARAAEMAPCRDLAGSLRSCPHVPLIAEIKRSSPSAGLIRDVDDAGERAVSYRAGGASAVSVLTDGPFFGGSLADLTRVRAAVDLPVLRKDFILDPLQLFEARAAGADAVLLIAAILDHGLLAELCAQAAELGLQPLVEVHDEKELEGIVSIAPPLVGINNRNLKTMQVNLDTSVRLRSLIPARTTVIAESGITRRQDILRLRRAGIDGFLVGTGLMSSDDPESAVRSLCFGEDA